jgi:hypothetical protein
MVFDIENGGNARELLGKPQKASVRIAGVSAEYFHSTSQRHYCCTSPPQPLPFTSFQIHHSLLFSFKTTTWIKFIRFVGNMFRNCVEVFWVMTTYNLECGYLHLQGRRLKRYDPSKRWYPPTRLHGVITKYTTMWIITAMSISNPIQETSKNTRPSPGLWFLSMSLSQCIAAKALKK